MPRKLYQVFARTIHARHHCEKHGNNEWFVEHTAKIEELVRNRMPNGSGFDHETSIDLIHSTGEKLVFFTAFHHMNENGFYDGWTNHTITVTASLNNQINVRVSGENRNEIKDYIEEIYYDALTNEVPDSE
ncbi:MAG: hypothetical protein Q8O83_02185 [bacterium]|nr:hypothetical protein [bacterium]